MTQRTRGDRWEPAAPTWRAAAVAPARSDDAAATPLHDRTRQVGLTGARTSAIDVGNAFRLSRKVDAAAWPPPRAASQGAPTPSVGVPTQLEAAAATCVRGGPAVVSSRARLTTAAPPGHLGFPRQRDLGGADSRDFHRSSARPVHEAGCAPTRSLGGMSCV
jgi:hypothetical protein